MAFLTFYATKKFTQIYPSGYNPEKYKDSDIESLVEEVHQFSVKNNLITGCKKPLEIKAIFLRTLGKNLENEICNRFSRRDQEYTKDVEEATEIFNDKKIEIISNFESLYTPHYESILRNIK